MCFLPAVGPALGERRWVNTFFLPAVGPVLGETQRVLGSLGGIAFYTGCKSLRSRIRGRDPQF